MLWRWRATSSMIEKAGPRDCPPARALLGLVVDVGLARLHQLRDRDLAWRGLLVARLQLGARFHGISSPDGRGELYQAVLARQLRCASCEAQLGPYHDSN